MAIENLVKFDMLPRDGEDVYMRLLQALRCNPERWEHLMTCAEKLGYNSSSIDRLTERCKTLEGQCELFSRLLRHYACPGNQNFSKITIDEYSDDAQVNIDQIVQGLGGDYVNAFPVNPSKIIRLEQAERPGYQPTAIRVDLNLSGGANNYLDFFVQFYLGPGGNQTGKPIGSVFRGNQFLNKDGTQIQMKFPEYRGMPIDIGSLERLAVTIANKGAATNLDSAQVYVQYDNDRFYQLCKSDGCSGGCAVPGLA
jgi:hypothetical protein